MMSKRSGISISLYTGTTWYSVTGTVGGTTRRDSDCIKSRPHFAENGDYTCRNTIVAVIGDYSRDFRQKLCSTHEPECHGAVPFYNSPGFCQFLQRVSIAC